MWFVDVLVCAIHHRPVPVPGTSNYGQGRGFVKWPIRRHPAESGLREEEEEEEGYDDDYDLYWERGSRVGMNFICCVVRVRCAPPGDGGVPARTGASTACSGIRIVARARRSRRHRKRSPPRTWPGHPTPTLADGPG